MTPQTLESGALRLVPLEITHATDFLRLANEPSIAARVNHPTPFTLEHLALLMAQMQQNDRHFVWMMEVEGQICGMINTASQRHPQKFQGGYWVEPAFRGRGFAGLALGLVKDFLFTQCDAIRVQALVEPDNVPSIRVLERNGFVCEGLLARYFPMNDVDLVDVCMYAALAK